PGGSVSAGAFGEEHVKYKIDNVSWGKLPTVVPTAYVAARIFLDIDWGIAAHGHTNISSENDPVVTKDTYAAIAADLTTDATGRPTRATYWCQDITEKHEKFHATDDIGRATLYLPTAQSFINGKTITNPSDPVASQVEVSAMLETMRANVQADGWAWYGGGGENRAYADGKATYDARVAAINAKATTAGWNAPAGGAAAGGTPAGGAGAGP